jgi:hypothetical protein
MTDYNESDLCFSFGSDWQVIKVDGHPDYQSVFQTIPGTKAVDFLGLQKGSVYFIEVKNFSSDLARSEPKIRGEELANVLAQKFRDTVFIVLAGHHRYQRPDWQIYANAIGNRNPIKFIAWIELDYQSRNAVEQRRLQALWSVLAQRLRQKLGHLTRFDNNFHIIVTSSNNPTILKNLTVRDAPC